MPAGFKLGPVALLLMGMSYLGLVLFLGTSTPFLLVRGSSMEPTFRTGDLLLSKRPPNSEIKVGDVIAFTVPPDAPEELNFPPIVTHRVIGMEGREGQLVFITQGDNTTVDPFQVPPDLVRGVVIKNLGPVGRPILFLTNKKVLLYVGLPILAFALVVVATLALTPKKKEEDQEVDVVLDRMTGVLAEFGAHLESHTEIVVNLKHVTRELHQTVRNLNGVASGPYHAGQEFDSSTFPVGESASDRQNVSGPRLHGDNDESTEAVK